MPTKDNALSFQVGFESKTAGSNLISLSQIKNYAHDRGGPGPASSWCCDPAPVSLVTTEGAGEARPDTQSG